MSEDEVSSCPLELSRAEPSFSTTASTLRFKFSTLSDGSIMNHCWSLEMKTGHTKREFLLDKLVLCKRGKRESVGSNYNSHCINVTDLLL